MRWADLDPRDLFDLSASGTHRFAAGRTVLLDAGLLSLLSRLSPDLPGEARTSQLLRDLGYVQGWRLAGRALAIFPTTTETDVWQFAAHCGTWLGLGQIAPEHSPLFPTSLAWQNSLEAGYQQGDIGPEREPVCRFLAGFLAGCASRALQRSVACDEERCLAQGHSGCHFLPRSGAELTEDEAWRLPRLQVMAETWPEAPDEHRDDQALEDDLGLGARSPHMREVVRLAKRVAPVDLTVLLTGESGVGKERLAEFVHRHSKRAGRPYIPVNCAALPDALLESELFGHRRGAFTGALEEHEGLFEAANQGTIFLDEIGEISPPLQAKLLRVLGDLTIRRVGETKYRKVDVRVIAATNRDLARDVREGRFREDLYYRLNVVAVHVPALRDRPEDLRLLLRTILTKATRRLDRQVTGYTPQALDALLAYSWPGNIRELENAIERACAVALGSRIDLSDLPDHVRRPARPIASSATRPLKDVEREHILAALETAGGNRAHAAELLQISRQTMFRRLREYGVPLMTERQYQKETRVPE
jgi:DNA-binding NtrC family response regulator